MIGYYGIFGSVLVLNAINFTYVAVFLKETRGPRAHPRYARCQREGDVDADLGGQREEPKNLFSLDHIKSILDTSFKRRPNNMRTVLLILIAAMILNESVYSKCHPETFMNFHQSHPFMICTLCSDWKYQLPLHPPEI